MDIQRLANYADELRDLIAATSVFVDLAGETSEPNTVRRSVALALGEVTRRAAALRELADVLAITHGS